MNKLYVYANGNPVSLVDPMGLASICYRPLNGMRFVIEINLMKG